MMKTNFIDMAYLSDMNTTNLGVDARISGICIRIGDGKDICEVLIFISIVVTFGPRKSIISRSHVTHAGIKFCQQLEGVSVFVLNDQVDGRKLGSRVRGRGGKDCVLYGAGFEVHIESVYCCIIGKW